MADLKDYSKFNVLPAIGFFDVGVSFAVQIEKLFNYEGAVETQSVGFSDIQWKLKFTRHTLAIPADDGSGSVVNIEVIHCSLYASASMTDDWSCTLNKHCLAWKPFDSVHRYFRNRPDNQYKMAGKRLLDGFAGYCNVSLPDEDVVDDTGNSVLVLTLEEAEQYAGPSKWLVCEMYIRGVGPITYYPTYSQNYDFGMKTCVTLRLMGRDNDPKTFKIPLSRLRKESRRFNIILQNEETTVVDLDIDVDALDFRMFLQCLLYPYLPLNKCTAETVKEVIRLAFNYGCDTLLRRCVEYLNETTEMTPNEKIYIGSLYSMPNVVLYALECMDGETICSYMQSDDYKHLNYETKLAVSRRYDECTES